MNCWLIALIAFAFAPASAFAFAFTSGFCFSRFCFRRAEHDRILSLSQRGRTNDEDEDETADDQGAGDEADEKDAASTGGKVAADDPVL